MKRPTQTGRMFETLEDRRLMSATLVSAQDGTAAGYLEQDNLYTAATAPARGEIMTEGITIHHEGFYRV
jgi:hypothetical protein